MNWRVVTLICNTSLFSFYFSFLTTTTKMIETTTTSTTVKKNLSTVSTADNDCLMYRPFQSPVGENTNLNIKRDHYSTSLDSRGYIPGKASKFLGFITNN
jgi:hypothetical protein